MKRLLLIDADYLVYRKGFGAQETVLLPDGTKECVLTEEEHYVMDTVQQAVDTIIHDTGAERWQLFIGGKGNYREDVATMFPYKGNRDKSSRPILYQEIRDYLTDNLQAVVVDGQEADDAVSIAHVKAYWEGDYEPVIVSNDKDLLNTYGLHYNPVREEFTYVKMLEAERNFYKQLLSGDSADNIPGLYKLTGKKATAKMKKEIDKLKTSSAMYDYVSSVYEDYYLKEDVDYLLREIGQLLWIRREENELWEPPIG